MRLHQCMIAVSVVVSGCSGSGARVSAPPQPAVGATPVRLPATQIPVDASVQFEEPWQTEDPSSQPLRQGSDGASDPVAPTAPLAPMATGPTEPPIAQLATEPCVPADWTPRALEPLLRRGKADSTHAEVSVIMSEGQRMTDILGGNSPCSDAPSEVPRYPDPLSRTLSNGVRVSLVNATAAGKSGRGWPGNRCQFAVELPGSAGRAVMLNPDIVPPFNSIYAVLRHGSAAYIGLQFNGYAREFPRGGCKVIAVDLCDGKVKWKSANYTSNGDLALIGGDYLLTGYGFTAEKRIIQIADARTGKVIQTLRIPGNPESLEFVGNQLTVQTNHGPAVFNF